MRGNVLIFPVLSAAFILLLQAGCQRPVTGITDANRPGPKITFEKTIHDFGDVGPQTRKTCEFKFENSGDSVLRISEVEVCCGVTAEVDKQEYSPGESGVVKVEYQVSSQPGSEEKRFYVRSNDWARHTVTLTLKANVVPKVQWQPDSLKLVFNKPNAGCPEITIKALDGKPFAITEFKSTGDCITADVDRSAKAAEFVLQPKVDVEKLKKNMSGYIYITGTHSEWDKVTIVYEALPRFTSNPSMIIVFNARPKQPIVKDVLLINNYGEDFEVDSTSAKNDYIKVRNQKKLDNGYKFEVEITPPDAAAQSNFTDELVINIKDKGQFSILCRGFYEMRK